MRIDIGLRWTLLAKHSAKLALVADLLAFVKQRLLSAGIVFVVWLRCPDSLQQVRDQLQSSQVLFRFGVRHSLLLEVLLQLEEPLRTVCEACLRGLGRCVRCVRSIAQKRQHRLILLLLS